MKTQRVLALLSLLALAACGSDVHGSWTGTWTSAGSSSGTVRLDLRQNGGDVTGVGTFTGSGCLTSGSVTAKVDGDKFAGSVDSGPVSWKFAATVANDAPSIGGTFDFSGAGCSGQSGTWTAAR